MRKLIGASVAALGLTATALIAAPAAQATVNPATYNDNCYFGSKGEVLTCLKTEKSSAKVMKKVYLDGYMNPTVVMSSGAMKGQQVCLYRLHQPGTTSESTEIQACDTVNADGTFRFYAKLGFKGTYSYVVGPKKVKPKKGEVWFTPDVQITTK